MKNKRLCEILAVVGIYLLAMIFLILAFATNNWVSTTVEDNGSNSTHDWMSTTAEVTGYNFTNNWVSTAVEDPWSNFGLIKWCISDICEFGKENHTCKSLI